VLNKRFSNTTVQLYVEKLDFAWVTDYPEVHFKSKIRLLAVPLSKGRPYFTSYLIVPAYNDKTTSLLQLKGAMFAFTDPSQNGSYLEVRHQLLNAGEDPARFFSKTIFTGSHREVIKAVALGLVHAGEVDSVVWDSLAKTRPDLASHTRIAGISHEYGAPPIVANHFVSQKDFKNMQHVLVSMATDAGGIELLKRMGLDGFTPGDERIYARSIKMRQILSGE
jgi:phosphonate transport system substrate-binding protein